MKRTNDQTTVNYDDDDDDDYDDDDNTSYDRSTNNSSSSRDLLAFYRQRDQKLLFDRSRTMGNNMVKMTDCDQQHPTSSSRPYASDSRNNSVMQPRMLLPMMRFAGDGRRTMSYHRQRIPDNLVEKLDEVRYQHANNKGKLDRKIECGCGRTFSYIGGYTYHLRWECGKTLSCRKCGKVFKDKAYMMKHAKTCGLAHPTKWDLHG